MRGIHGLVILAQELGTLAFGQVPENDLGVIWILDVDRLSGHDPSLRPTPDAQPARLSGTRGKSTATQNRRSLYGSRRDSERAAPVKSAIITAPSTRNPAETGSSPQLTMVGPVYGEYGLICT